MTFVRIVKDRCSRALQRLRWTSWIWPVCWLLPVLLCITNVYVCKEATFARKIQAISISDRAILEAFFRVLMLKEGGAYVLFGNKPVAFTSFSHSLHEHMGAPQMRRYERENKLIKEGWETWKKYAPSFHSSRFILECRTHNNGREEICLIDQERYEQVIKDNLRDFQGVLGDETTPEILLKKYRSGNKTLFQTLHEHQALLGIVLGFGTENSWLFHEHTSMRYDDPNLIPDRPFKQIRSMPAALNQHKLKGIFNEKNHRKCVKFLHLPYFLADPNSEETRVLRAQYLQQQQAIQEAYAHGHFLEVTLKKFCL